jgi:predicted HAD superfamily Cof-like phosphohydrolase
MDRRDEREPGAVEGQYTARHLTLEQAAAAVRHFHETFGLPVRLEPAAELPPALLALRVNLLLEEVEEYRQAAQAGDMVAVADALTDILYVLLGTYVSHGLQDLASELFAEVQRSNMSKLDADGQPVVRADGKILKSALFSEPALAHIIEHHLRGQRSR